MSDHAYVAIPLRALREPEADGLLAACKDVGLRAWVYHSELDDETARDEVWQKLPLKSRNVIQHVTKFCPNGAKYVIDPLAIGWPGWRTAIEQLIAEAKGFADLIARPDGCRCLERSRAIKETLPKLQALTARTELSKGSDAQQLSIRRATLAQALVEFLEVLEGCPIATPEVANELMFEDDAGRILTVSQHQALVTSMRRLISEHAEQSTASRSRDQQSRNALTSIITALEAVQ